jgi:hypothetical protein
MQVVTDSHVGLIADVRVTQDVNDKFQLLPGMEGLESRCQQRPKEVVADGDFTTNLSVIQMAQGKRKPEQNVTLEPTRFIRTGSLFRICVIARWRRMFPSTRKAEATLGKNSLSKEEQQDPRRSICQRKRKLIERVFG